MNEESLARRVTDLALDAKALDVVTLDLREKAAYTDFIVIASGTSDRHVQSIAELVERALRKNDGVKPIGVEGVREGQWALVDFGSVVLHVFHQFTRATYAIEDLWEDAPRLTTEAAVAEVGA